MSALRSPLRSPHRQPPSVAGLIGWVFGLLGFALGCRPFADNSLFTHLATGRLIAESGIPRQDPYSFTAVGEPWVVQSWLVSAIYGEVDRIAGLGAVRVVSALFIAALLSITWRLTRPAQALIGRLVIMTLVMAASSAFWSPRPLLVGLALMAGALVIVEERHDPRWLVPIFWLWVNSHGSFPLGVLALACIAAGAWLDGERSREQWRPIFWAVVGTAAGAVGPLGPAVLVFPVQLLGRMEILQHVVEWQSPKFADLFARAFLVLVAVAVLVLVKRPSYRAAVPLVVFLALALTGQRSIPNAVLVLIPGIAPGLRLGRITGRERSPVVWVAGAVLTVVAVVASVSVLSRPDVDLRSYPTDAVSWLEQQGLIGSEARVATQDYVGNVFELLYGTRHRVFFDDRFDMYPRAMSEDYLALNDAKPDWDDALGRHSVDYLVWSRPSPLAGLVAASPRWRIVYQDPKSFVACHRVELKHC